MFKLARGTFLLQNGIFFIGSVVTSALNYLFYPVLSRMLHPTAFGETQALVSLFLQVGIFLAVLGTLVINLMTQREESADRNRLILELEKFAFFVSVAMLLLAIIFSKALQNFFHFETYIPFIILAVAICVTVPYTFRSSYLRGKQKFGQAALAGIVGAGNKLLFAALLVKIGLGTTGAILGVVIAQLISFIYAGHFAKRSGFQESLFKHFIRLPDMKLILPELRYAGIILTCSLIITGLYSVDIIVVKHYFDAHTAGLYAGIATVARIVFFLTASIVQVMIPNIKARQSNTYNQAVLRKSLALLTALGGSTVLLFYLAPDFVVSHLMGQTYLAYAPLLPRLSLAIFLISFLNMIISYYLALRRNGIALIAIIGGATTAVFLLLRHDNLVAVVNSLLYGSLAMFAALGIWLAVDMGKKRLYKENRLWHSN